MCGNVCGTRQVNQRAWRWPGIGLSVARSVLSITRLGNGQPVPHRGTCGRLLEENAESRGRRGGEPTPRQQPRGYASR